MDTGVEEIEANRGEVRDRGGYRREQRRVGTGEAETGADTGGGRDRGGYRR